LNLPKIRAVKVSEEITVKVQDALMQHHKEPEKLQKIKKLREMKKFEDLFQKEWDFVIENWKVYAKLTSLLHREADFSLLLIAYKKEVQFKKLNMLINEFREDLKDDHNFIAIKKEVLSILNGKENGVIKITEETEVERISRTIAKDLLNSRHIVHYSKMLKYLSKLMELPKLYADPRAGLNGLQLFNQDVENSPSKTLINRINKFIQTL